MLLNSNDINFLCGNIDILNDIQNVSILPSFSEQMKNFLHNLSQAILKDKRTKYYPDVTTYAFWIRKAHIEKTQTKMSGIENRLGRGVAFHITPSNVPVNFAVSLTSALLAGNPCIARVSNKDFVQVNIICDAINFVVSNKMPEMKKYICVIRYDHSDEITQQLSSIADIRIIWGGDRTINEIRRAKLPPRSIELTFSDRHSFSIINSDEYIMSDYNKVANGFYIDTFFTDQNACSSPRLVVWTGNKVKEAKEIFWKTLEQKVQKEYDLKPIQVVNKLVSFCKFASIHTNIQVKKNSNYIIRIELNDLKEDLMRYKDNSGYFFEYETQNLEDIKPILTKPCQTISYFGIDRNIIKNIVTTYGTKGTDRIVEIGKTMDISFIWDGYNMVEAMSRILFLN